MSHPVVRHWRLIPPHRYAYLWMKYVVDADLSQHCQNSLIGTKSKKFSKGAKAGYADAAPIVLDEAESPFFYICGGSSDFNYEKNLHIAFRYKFGDSFELRTPQEHWIIDHAERIEISETHLDKTEPNYGDPIFRTCRNWQFAHYVRRWRQEQNTTGIWNLFDARL